MANLHYQDIMLLELFEENRDLEHTRVNIYIYMYMEQVKNKNIGTER